jgi:flagellar hook assembly protein FlgD
MVVNNSVSPPGHEEEIPATANDRTPEEEQLLQNYPNPGNPSTTIRFSIPEAGHVTVRIMNIRGQVIRRLVDGYRESGQYSVVWEGRNHAGLEVPSGIYLYVLEAGEQRLTRKLTLLK